MGASIYIADDEKNIRDLITKFLGATAEMLIKSLDRGEMDWREIYRRND